ncbi:predicted protein, partial [Nematostella vectensis]
GSSLTLSSVGTDDRGNYTCNVTSTCGTTMKTASLDVILPPLVAKFPSSEVTIMEGHPSKLMCNVTGSPVPNATWYKQGFEGWYHSGPMLVLSKKNDAGSYRCIATNEAWYNCGLPYSLFSINLHCTVPPLVAEFPSSEVTIMEGHPAKLMCNVTGSPVPNATWYKQGFEGWYHSGPMLVLSKKNDAGSYRCIATNEA